MKLKSRSTWQKTSAFLGSKYFFYITLVLFIVGATWIAISGRFPMPFDEEMHLGIIDFYTRQLNPFTSTQPAALNQFGGVVHNPSYLYHYIMSFPWRLIRTFLDDVIAQVIVMRLINIALFTYGAIIFRKVLALATKKQAVINLVFFLFLMTPIVPQLAAQINYDNLLFPLIAWTILLTIQFVQKLQKGTVDTPRLVLWLVLCMIASIVKYTFLPIFVVLFFVIVLSIWRYSGKKFIPNLAKAFKNMSAKYKLLLVIILVISAGLFFERYGLNILRYGTPLPDCVQTIGESGCQSYSIYQRGLLYAQTKPAHINWSPLYFSGLWLMHMFFSIMYSLNGPAGGYAVGIPLLLPKFVMLAFFVTGFFFAAWQWRKVFSSTAAKIFGFVTAGYAMTLWLNNYISYIHTGRRVAVQGRYLVPFLPMIYLLLAMGLYYGLQRYIKVRAILVTVLIAGLLLGGGALTYILHSDSVWYWEDQTIVDINKRLQSSIGYVVPGARYHNYWEPSDASQNVKELKAILRPWSNNPFAN